mgnify:CR=1 FL=1
MKSICEYVNEVSFQMTPELHAKMMSGIKKDKEEQRKNEENAVNSLLKIYKKYGFVFSPRNRKITVPCITDDRYECSCSKNIGNVISVKIEFSSKMKEFRSEIDVSLVSKVSGFGVKELSVISDALDDTKKCIAELNAFYKNGEMDNLPFDN